ncbi:MAG: beta-lactamase family protein [Bacteroidetes bacterium]|nr:beta-lactamase family protein [Bacteroidota bacterium]
MKPFLLLAFILHTSLTFSQGLVPGKPNENGMSPERIARIDQMMEEQVKNKWIPGGVVLVARNGKIVYHKAYGYSDAEKQVAMKKEDIFRIASQSKAITSLAVMMLFEEGKLLLDDPVSKYILEFKNPKVLVNLRWADTTYTTTPAKSEITIRQLLTHSSGIGYSNIGTQEFNAIYAKAGIPSGIGVSSPMLLADKMKVLGGMPLKHNPGEQFTYGLNTDVLGYLVEVVSGMSLDQFFKTRIFQPLGMYDTYFYLPKEKHSRLVNVYQVKNDVLQKVPGTVYDKVNPAYPTLDLKYYSGGAGLSSTAEDYAKFLQMFLNKGEYNGVRLLSRKTVELMLTNQLQPPITTQFGLGFEIETDKTDFQNIYSQGTFSWGGAFASNYWADPKEKLIGVIMTNMYNSDGHGRSDKFKVLTYQAITD